jgi:hypothetical protein
VKRAFVDSQSLPQRPHDRLGKTHDQFWLAPYRQGGFSGLEVQSFDRLSRNDGGTGAEAAGDAGAARDGKGLAACWASDLTRP